MEQDNKPNNTTLNSMGPPARTGKKSQENQAQEFINEIEKPGGTSPGKLERPSTAERGGQKPQKVPHS